MNDYEDFKMNDFETYIFTRLVSTQHVEFFFILGVNEARNFTEDWDGRLTEVLGYLVLYSDQNEDKQTNFIYLIEDEHKNFQEIILHTKMFTVEMHTPFEFLDMADDENFIIQKTNVYQKGLLKEEIGDFIKKIVGKDIPEVDLHDLTSD